MNKAVQLIEHLPADFRRMAWPIAMGTLATTVVVIALVGLWRLASIALLIFGGMMFGIFLRGTVEQVMRRTPLGRKTAATVVITALLLLVGVLAWIMGPSLLSSFDNLVDSLPGAWQALQEWLNRYPLLERLAGQLQSMASGMQSQMANMMMNLVSAGVWGVTAAVVMFFTGLYFAVEPRTYARGFVSLIPPARRQRTEQVLDELDHSLRWWLVGRLASMAVVAVLTWIGLLIFGLPSALSLAVIAGLLSFIPNLGPVLSVLPAFAVAVTQGFQMVLWVGLLYIGIQTVESYLITPLIQRKAVTLPPVYILTFQLSMGLLFGILGLLLATPLGVVALVLVKMLYIQDRLHEPTGLPSGNRSS